MDTKISEQFLMKLLLLFCLTVISSPVKSSDSSLKQMKEEKITTLFGRPIGSKTSLLTAGYHGPALLQDVQFLEEMAHFDRERIPERVVHAKGSGAFGVFRVTSPEIRKYTKAKLFESPGKTTEVAVRFSTVAGEVGSADTVFGDPRGFAVKFYTEEGNWDLVGNNVPMFFIRDSQQFPSVIHANKRNPQTGLPDPNAQWDFFSLRPETLNLITYMFSDYGIPDGFRHMPGFSIHAFKLINSENQAYFAKFHWLTNQGIKNLDVDTAQRLRGTAPDYARQDLFNAIKNNDFPSWTLSIQVITEEEAKRFKFNPFDATKIWPTEKYPLIEVGVMTLNRNPSNFFAEIEQMALCPANLVPGIEPSPDLLLAGRLFSYSDTQRHRLGTNFHLIPVNQPKMKTMPMTERDGFMRTDNNLGNMPNYYPNSFSGAKDSENYMETNFTVPKSMVYRYDDSAENNYEQPRDLYNNFPPEWRERLHRNIALSMKGVMDFIVERELMELKKVDPAFATGVRLEINKLNKKKRQSSTARNLKETSVRNPKTKSTRKNESRPGFRSFSRTDFGPPYEIAVQARRNRVG